MALEQLIRERLAAAGGRLTFAAYMDLALYHPELGYYRRGRSPVGRAGDFVTSPEVSPLFGRILGRFLAGLRVRLGEPPGFEVVEFGGHRGRLRADALAEAPGLPWRIVEAGDALPDRLTGVVLSNEFLDALPFHRVRAAGGAWQEQYVVAAPPGAPAAFAWAPGPLSDPRLADALAGLPVGWMEGYESEVSLRVPDWMADIGRRLERGYVLTVDYGLEREEYYAPSRARGTLRCFHRHRRHDDPLVLVGEQDITAHVEFTSVIEAGARAGLDVERFTDQARFLLAHGADLLEAEARAGRAGTVRQLIHPGLMGAAFRVLLQRTRTG